MDSLRIGRNLQAISGKNYRGLVLWQDLVKHAQPIPAEDSGSLGFGEAQAVDGGDEAGKGGHIGEVGWGNLDAVEIEAETDGVGTGHFYEVIQMAQDVFHVSRGRRGEKGGIKIDADYSSLGG